MGLLEKMAARQSGQSGRKAWSEPPFWEVPEPWWATSLTPGEEKIPGDYLSYAEAVFKCSPAVFACIRFRASVLSQARFQWRQIRAGQPGDLFGTQELGLLEQPWPNGSTADLLMRMEV